ncbi:MAG: hypothetical protein QM817_33310 [Archangium sp.]
MTAAVLIAALCFGQAPTLTPPPLLAPGEVPAVLDGKLIGEERAQLGRELAQLRKERPPIGYSVLMTSGGIFTFVVSGLLAANASSTLLVPSIIGLIVGGACAVVGIVLAIFAVTRLSDVNERIAVKQKALDALPRAPVSSDPVGLPPPL